MWGAQQLTVDGRIGFISFKSNRCMPRYSSHAPQLAADAHNHRRRQYPLLTRYEHLLVHLCVDISRRDPQPRIPLAWSIAGVVG